MLRKGLLVALVSLSLTTLAVAYPAPRAQELPQKAHGHLGLDLWVNHWSGEAYIWSVRNDTPAFRAGLKCGDILFEIDGRPIDDGEFVLDRIASCRPGSIVSITVLRRGELYTVFATIGHRTGSMTEAQSDRLF